MTLEAILYSLAKFQKVFMYIIPLMLVNYWRVFKISTLTT
jgi:hypothetical protein